mgnify:CR=1 FL=1
MLPTREKPDGTPASSGFGKTFPKKVWKRRTLKTEAENEAFGIFLRITKRKIRIFPEGTLVARRVGGLEVHPIYVAKELFVARRVGGLEGRGDALDQGHGVARRVGGLEAANVVFPIPGTVARRVGGLEDEPKSAPAKAPSCPPCRRFRSPRNRYGEFRRRCPPCRRFRSNVAAVCSLSHVARRVGGLEVQKSDCPRP